MGAIRFSHKLTTIISPMVILLCLFLPSLIWSAGYQEQKLYDTKVYTYKALKDGIETHSSEIREIDEQIRDLEMDIDWLVLKINYIRDSGREAPSHLKAAIPEKERKIQALQKNKKRLDKLVLHYSSTLKSNKQYIAEQNREKAANQKISTKTASRQKKTGVSDLKKSKKYSDITLTQLQAKIKKAGLSDWVEVVGTGTCLKIETTLPILFSTGSARIAKEYKSFFKKLAGFLKPFDVKIHIKGYADSVPIKNKKYPSNFELGATRAANIVHQFVTYGLKPSIFKIESTGRYRAASKGMSKQKMFERRAEVTVIFSG